MMTSNAVTCLTWVRRGIAKQCPDQLQLSDDQLAKLVRDKSKAGDDSDSQTDEDVTRKKGKKQNLESLDSDQSARQNGIAQDDIDAKYDLDDYDEEDGDSYAALSMAGLSFYPNNADDPYLTKDDDSDDDMTIDPDDNLVALGRLKDQDQFSLEVWVFNEATGSQYCHHDVILSKCPLVMEWVGYDPGDQTPGNLVAVGYLSPEIELWDLDVVNTLDPAFVLGAKKTKKKKEVKKKKLSTRGHSDSVMSLSWNRLQSQILASGSADNTVGIWDLTSGSVISMLRHHKDKVGAVEWHPVEAQTLATGSYDNSAKVFDCRTPDVAHKTWDVGSQVTNILWNHHDPFYFYASTDSGTVHCIDVRAHKPMFSMSAHESEVSGLALSPAIPGCLVTSSDDHSVKIWDMRQSHPQLVATKKYKIGSVFCVSACPDSALVFGIGGENEMKILNLKRDDAVASRFMSDTSPNDNTELVKESVVDTQLEPDIPVQPTAERDEIKEPTLKKSKLPDRRKKPKKVHKTHKK